MGNKPRVVVCAATKCEATGDVVVGARHYDQVMHAQIKVLRDVQYERGRYFANGASIVQGFIDQFGVFMTREEAYAVAKEAGQIKYRCGGDEGKLFSENLY